jgi:tetratricopeptide (TPR) repeat protein
LTGGSAAALAAAILQTRATSMAKLIRLTVLVCVMSIGSAARGGEESSTSAQAAARSIVDQQAERLVQELGDDDYAVREDATTKLIEMGEAALPLLKQAEGSADLEVAWRAEGAARMIRWRVSPELWSTFGDLVEEFEQADPSVRERIVRIMRTVGDQRAIPVLRQVLRADCREAVKQVAAIMLADLGSEGLAVLMEEGVEIAGLDPYDAAVHVLIGNSFLNEGNYEKAEDHYGTALKLEPENFIALYNMACVRSLQKRIDEAIEWLQKAVDAGYDEFEWMEKDEDLDNIREDERYKEILKRGPKHRKGESADPE